MSYYQQCVERFVGPCSKVRFAGAAPRLDLDLFDPLSAYDSPLPDYDSPFRIESPAPSDEKHVDSDNDWENPFGFWQEEAPAEAPGPRSVFTPQQEAFPGGETYRPIYCGLDKANMPKNAIMGNPLQCFRKGFYYGKRYKMHY